MSEDKIMCLPLTDPGYIAPGSVEEHCSVCGQAVWLAPSSQEHRKSSPLDLICLPCALEFMRDHGESIELRRITGQGPELKDWAARN